MSTELEALQNMNDVLSTKDSLYLTFTANSSTFTQTFPYPIHLLPNRKYEACLNYFTTSNYQINIDETNNEFYYLWDKKAHIITFEKGAYEFSLNQ
mgnify:CR=1 FL=1